MATIRCGSICFENIQAVLFDKDGTLADSQAFLISIGYKRARLIDAQVPGIQEPLLMAFGLDGDRLNSAGLLAVGTRKENEIAAAAYVAETGRDWLPALQLVQSAFIEADKICDRKAIHTPLIDGAQTLLQSLFAAEISVGLISSDTPQNTQDFVDYYQLNSLIQVVYGSGTQLSKPDPEILRKACQALSVFPEQTLVIGDSLVDIEMARTAGAAGCLGVSPSIPSSADMHKADAVIHHFSDIQVHS